MRSSDNIGVTFINSIIGRGIYNGVINLSLAVFNFSPNDKGEVEIDPTIAARLRMDRACATQLRDTLTDLINMIEVAEKQAVPGFEAPQAEGLMPKTPDSLN